MCGPVWQATAFPPSQKLPDGYEVGREFDETGFGNWFWWHRQTNAAAKRSHASRWGARRDAIEHHNSIVKT